MNNMDVVKRIQREDKREKDLKTIEEMAGHEKNIIEEEYNKEPCPHNIVIKLYNSYFNKKCKIAYYYCLGCGQWLTHLSLKATKIEKHHIIDLIDLDCGSTYAYGKNLLVSYMQSLAIKANEKNPNYSDSDFVDMVEKNKALINVPSNFKPRNI